MAIEKCMNRVGEAEEADSITQVIDRPPERLGRWIIEDFRVCAVVWPDGRFESDSQMSSVEDVAGSHAVCVDILRRA